MDQNNLIIKFVRAQIQHVEAFKCLQREEEEGFDILEGSRSTILYAGHVILGACDANSSLQSHEEANPDPAFKDFSKWLIKWLTANLIHQFNKSAASVKLDADDKVCV